MAVKHVFDPITQLAELQVAQFISDALRAGQRAILVTGGGRISTQVPEEALAACAGASTGVLHIRPPLPEAPDLQEMIGAAVEIAGGREMTPQAMAQLLLLADPRPAVILAIDDAHTLSHRSLSYLTLMTELLAPDAPILQIVLAAEPALLDTLAQPKFERLRNRLFRPKWETFQTLHGGSANGAVSGLRRPAHGGAPTGLAHVQHADPPAASPRDHGIARPKVYAAGGAVAIGCVAAIGYIAFSVFTVGPTLPPIPSLNSPAEQLGAAGNGDRAALSPAASPAPLSAAPEAGLNFFPASIVRNRYNFADRAAPTAPDGAAAPAPAVAVPGQDVDEGPPATLAETAPTTPSQPAAPSTEQLGAAGNGAAFSPNAAAPAPPVAAADQNVDGTPRVTSAKTAPTAPSPPAAPSAEQFGAAASGDRAASSPNSAAPVPPVAAADQNVGGTTPATLAERSPTTPSQPFAPSAEQLGAADNGDRAATSPSAAPGPPSAAPDQNHDGAPPATLAETAPTTPSQSAASSAEQPGAAANGDRAALSPNSAAPAPAVAAADQNVDGARPATLAEIAPTALDDRAALSAEQLGAAGSGDRAASSLGAAAPAPPKVAPDKNVDAPPLMLAKAAPTAPDGVAARVVAGLPRLAPVRVILNAARDASDRAARLTDIERALTAAGLEVSDLVPVNAQQPAPGIGYYFQSDRNAAAEVSHLLEPLLGALDPVALRKRGNLPEPGTIEIAIPRSAPPFIRRGAILDVRPGQASHSP